MITKKIIYILGTGRSGSTLLEIAIGNSDNIFDAGELVRYFKKNGIPNGFSENSDNFLFWKKVSEDFFTKYPEETYENLYNIASYFEYHSNFLLNLLGIMSRNKIKYYKQIINDFYQSIYNNVNEEWIIDASKYPGRALTLEKYLNAQVYFIYLIRNPKGVIKSFRKKDLEQPSQSFISANIYYFIINLYARLTQLIIPNKRFITVKYENFIKNPVKELTKIQNKFNIDLSKSCELIENKRPLKIGYLFDGNRIRLNSEINLQKSNFYYKKNIKNFFVDLINGIWYI